MKLNDMFRTPVYSEVTTNVKFYFDSKYPIYTQNF